MIELSKTDLGLWTYREEIPNDAIDEAINIFVNCFFLVESADFSEGYDGVDDRIGYNLYYLRKYADLKKALLAISSLRNFMNKYNMTSLQGQFPRDAHQYMHEYASILLCDNEDIIRVKELDEIKEICQSNHIRLFIKGNIKKDYFTGEEYKLKTESYPGSADDAATYLYVSLEKIE